MQGKHEQYQEYRFSNQYDGYTGNPEQPFSDEQQTFSRQEQPTVQGYAQTRSTPPVPPLNGMELSAILSYALFWFTGLLFILLGGQSRYVRFHALQSLLFFGAINVIDILLMFFMFSWRIHFAFPLLSVFAFLFFLLLNAVAFICWIVAMIQAGRGAYFKLPFVGNLVARRVNANITLK